MGEVQICYLQPCKLCVIFKEKAKWTGGCFSKLLRRGRRNLARFDGKRLTRLKESKLGQEYRRQEAEENPHL